MVLLSVDDAYRRSDFPLPELPQLTNVSLWDITFTHSSLPNNNTVVAMLGHGVFSTCVAEWLIDADPALTPDELRTRSHERVNKPLLSAFADVYALPPALQYSKNVAESQRYSIDDGATLFTAYIGALHKEQGFDVTKEWIIKLMDWDNLTMLQNLQQQN